MSALLLAPAGKPCHSFLIAIPPRNINVNPLPNVKPLPHQPPQLAKANGIELCYEIFGTDDAEPMLLIMGLGAQMILWDDEFCE